ncbi:MAG: 3'-5' exonuclease [Candidatus Doudnabacteria bacterium]|nr:3'-5' exonuclease [Candidatus Doudnabacteria bacterium]
MDFKRDILLIDTEFSGFDVPKKHDLLQIAAVLLDKKTLKEKKSFNTYIKPAKWGSRDPESMAVNKITWEMVKSAPDLKFAIKKFSRAFPKNVIQAFYVGYNDKRILMDAYNRAGVKWPFDYHYFDLWALFYGYLARHNKLNSKNDFAGFGLEYLIKALKIDIDKSQMHDALVDCRLEAEVLRKIMRAL